MAKMVQPVDILPPPSSSDDETEDQEGSRSSSNSTSSDDEQHHHPPQPREAQESEEESDDESGDDENENENKAEPVVKQPSVQVQQAQESEETEDDENDIEPEPVQQPQESEESDDESEDDEKENENEPEPVVKKPCLPQAQESEESDDETDADSDDSPSASAFTVRPIVSKSPEPNTPVLKTTTESEDIGKASETVLKNQEPVRVEEGNSKRPAEIETEKIDKVSKNKKSKVSNGEGQSVGKVDKGSEARKMGSGDEIGVEAKVKKSIFKWTEKDEIALLGGIIDYKAETGNDVNLNVNTFNEYVKDLFSVNLTKIQLYEKIRRLKNKFQTNDKKCQSGEEPVYLRPHENKLFELSKKIWGSEGTFTERNDSKVKNSMNKDKNNGIVAGNTSTPIKSVTKREFLVQEEVKDTIMEDKTEEKRDFWSLYPRLCASLKSEGAGYLTPTVGDSKEYVNEMISGMGGEKAKELENDWKAVYLMRHQLYARRASLISKQAEAVLDSPNLF